jgi:dihydrofolate reductase
MRGDTGEIVLLIARADNGVIGADGDIPWKIPGEQARFKSLTMGTPMIMGRKTFDSLPGLLPGRRHIVMTRDLLWQAPGAEVAHSVADAIALAGGSPIVSVIGGAQVYDLFEPLALRMELTEVHCAPEGDARIPYPDPARWQTMSRQTMPAREGVPGFSYVTLIRA